jgi:hypothetical protein
MSLSKNHQLTKKYLVLLLLFLVTIAAIAINGYLQPDPDDLFLAKFRQVRPGMKYEEVEQILGPPDDELHPGGSFGDHIYCWHGDRGREIVVTWDIFGEFKSKHLLPESQPWWKRILSFLGFS